MIISASRRTDIPAYFSEWFCNRIQEKFCYVRNPYSQKIKRVSLTREDTDVIVFWTKNAKPMLEKLPVIDASGIQYYFQYTVTPYRTDVEPCLEKNECIENFLELSEILGKERMLWRYDPILITETYSIDFHVKAFANLCETFSGAASRCTISFVDVYHASSPRPCTFYEMECIAKRFSVTAKRFELPLVSCAEKIDLNRFGIEHAACIDKEVCEHICKRSLSLIPKRDFNQRAACGCAESIDIGAYNTCKNGCQYCYACNSRISMTHDPRSPLLTGWPKEEEQMQIRNSDQTMLLK